MFFKIFGGFSEIALQLAPCLLSLIALFSFYFLLLNWFGKNVAFLSSFLFVFSTPIFYWNFKLYAGYIELLSLIPWILFIEEKIIKDISLNFKLHLLIGFLFGFGLWLMEFMLPFIFAFLLIIIFVLRTRALKRFHLMLYFLIGFLIGYLPSIVYNFTNNFANWKFILLGGRANIFEGMGVKVVFAPIYFIYSIFKVPQAFSFFPRFFEPDNEWSFLKPVSIVSWIQFILFLIVISYLVIFKTKRFLSMFFSFLKGSDKFLREPDETFRLFLILFNIFLFSLIVLPIYFSTQLTGYRYLIPAYMWFNLFITLLYFKLRNRTFLFKISGDTLIFVFILSGFYGYWKTWNNSGEYTRVDVYFERGMKKIFFVEVSNNSLKEVIQFLNNENIYHAYVPEMTLFLFRYYSNEQIYTASFPKPQGYRDKYPEIAKEVYRAERFAIVTFKVNPITTWLIDELDKRHINYKIKLIREFSVFYPLRRIDFY